MDPKTPNLDLLLRQTGWLQGLAQRLVSDQASAEDVVQETLLAAMESPPRGAGSPPVLRAWLAQVLRGKVRHARRSRRRRIVREELVARPESSAGSDAERLVGRAESSSMLVHAVMELPEPHRSVLVLRYFEGLDSKAIGTELGISSEAVRSRLVRAHAKLREALDQRHAEDRELWLSSLLPVAGGSPAPAALSLPALGGGLFAMKLAAAVLAAVLAIVFTRQMLAEGPPPQPALTRMEAESTAAPVLGPGPKAPEGRRAAAAASSEEAERPEHQALGTDGWFRPLLVGRVESSQGGPIAGARVTSGWGVADFASWDRVEALTDEEGLYRLQLPARAPISIHSHLDGREGRVDSDVMTVVQVSAEEFVGQLATPTYPRGEPDVFPLSFVLEPQAPNVGWLVTVSDPNGQPAPGVQVGLFDADQGKLLTEEGYSFWSQSDLWGQVRFDRHPSVSVYPVAYSRRRWIGFGQRQAPLSAGSVEIRIALEQHASLRGQLFDAMGKPVADHYLRIGRAQNDGAEPDWTEVRRSPDLASLEFPWLGLGLDSATSRTGHDGRFQVGGLAPGEYWVQLLDGSTHGPFALGDDLQLVMPDEYSVKIRVVDKAGHAVRGAEVEAYQGRQVRRADKHHPPSGLIDLGLGAGTWSLSAVHGDAPRTRRRIQIPEDAGRVIDLELDFAFTPLPFSLAILSPSGEPAPDARVIVERTDAPSSAMPFDAKQPSAVLTTQVRAGAYRVTVYPPQAQAESWLPVEEILEVSAPGFQEPYRMAFELGGHLQLQWEGSLASEWEAGRILRLELLPEGTDRNYWLEAGGGFLSTRLPWSIPSRGEPFDPAKRPLEDGPLLSAGAYRLVVHGPGLQPEEVRIQIVAGEMAQAVLPLEPAE